MPRLSDSKFSFSYSQWHFGFKNLLVGLCFSKTTNRANLFKNANFSPRVISRIHDYETRVANFIILSVWGGDASVPQRVSQDQWNQPQMQKKMGRFEKHEVLELMNVSEDAYRKNIGRSETLRESNKTNSKRRP